MISLDSNEDCLPDIALDMAGHSVRGKVRSENQDHFLIADLKRLLTVRSSNVTHEECDRLVSSKTGHLLVVADGMGGHTGGDVASTTAVQSCAQYVLDMMHWFLKLSADDENDFLDELSDCLKLVQKRLWRRQKDEYDRMGTTLTLAYLLGGRMYVVHAGDSRCYLFRDGHLQQLTTDHTLAQKLVDDGALTPDDAKKSRWRHMLWNCVGGGSDVVDPEVSKVVLEPNDTILLCSDGVTGMIDDAEIRNIIDAAKSSDQAVKRLVDASNEAGGKDNITAVVTRVQGDATKSAEGFGDTLRDTDEA